MGSENGGEKQRRQPREPEEIDADNGPGDLWDEKREDSEPDTLSAVVPKLREIDLESDEKHQIDDTDVTEQDDRFPAF